MWSTLLGMSLEMFTPVNKLATTAVLPVTVVVGRYILDITCRHQGAILVWGLLQLILKARLRFTFDFAIMRTCMPTLCKRSVGKIRYVNDAQELLRHSCESSVLKALIYYKRNRRMNCDVILNEIKPRKSFRLVSCRLPTSDLRSPETFALSTVYS